MDALDLFFKKYSYKFPKGYPDLNDEQDINLLADLLEGLDINLEEVNLGRTQLKKRNNVDLFLDSFFKKEPFNTNDGEVILDIITIKPDTFTIEDIDKKDIIKDRILNSKGEIKVSGKYQSGEFFSGTTGKLIKTEKFGGVGGGGHGVENEKIFNDTINNIIETNQNPINIKIIDKSNKTLTIEEVTKAEHQGAKGAKADVLLKSNNRDTPISIKKDGQFRWESIVSRYKELINNFIDKGQKGLIPKLKLTPENDILIMTNSETNEKYGRVYITDYPPLEKDAEDMIFGPDKVKIVQKTFSPEDFSFNENLLTIKVTKIYLDINDLEKDDMPIISISRNINRKATKGLDFRTIPLKDMSQTSGLVVKSSDII
jgi:hypothetical protein